ncbi:MAG: ROK family protein [Roseburia sp.]
MYRAGIDLGGTNIKAGIVGEDQKILMEGSVPTKAERSYQDVIRDMADLVKSLLRKLNFEEEKLSGVGVGSPGTIDAVNGIVLYSNNFGWENVPLVKEMKRYFSCPVSISNDANCAALGEVKAGAAKKISNAVLLTLGTGVGGGVILEGKVFEGAHAGGTELGHTSLIYGGKLCTCGRRGCVEAYVSATALIRDARQAALEHPKSKMNELCGGELSQMNGKIPFDAAWDGDETAKEVVNQYITYLGEAIANLVNIFRPDVVLLSGGVCNQGEKLTKPVNEYIKDKCFAGNKAFIPDVKCAILGNSAGIIGAANLIA